MFSDAYFEGAALLEEVPFPRPTGQDETCRKEHQDLFRQPSLYLISDLFRATQLQKRAVARDTILETNCGDKVMHFSGERFDQGDLDVFLVCVRSATERTGRSGPTVHFRFNDLLGALGRHRDNSGRAWLVRSLCRLESGHLEISDRTRNCRIRFINQVMFDHGQGTCLIELNADLAGTFNRANRFLPFLRERLDLGHRSLAKWLNGVLWTIQGVCIIDLQRLNRLSGFPSGSLEAFSTEVEKALICLQESGIIPSWTVSPGKNFVIGKDCTGMGECVLVI